MTNYSHGNLLVHLQQSTTALAVRDKVIGLGDESTWDCAAIIDGSKQVSLAFGLVGNPTNSSDSLWPVIKLTMFSHGLQ
jgi:predicted secreted protein